MEERPEVVAASAIPKGGIRPEQTLKVLEALRQASEDLRRSPHDPYSSAINALLELHTEADTILVSYPNLAGLARHLAELKSLIHSLRARNGLRSLLARRRASRQVSRLAASIEAEIQAWIDRESIEELLGLLRDPGGGGGEGRLRTALAAFEARVSQGFDRELQDLVLRSRIFASLEGVLCEGEGRSKEVREAAAFAIAALIGFNKDVFVGEVLIGATVAALVSTPSVAYFRVLCSLIRCIKSPLVDEMEFRGGIPKIIAALGSPDPRIGAAAMDCVLDIGYYGRREAIGAMVREGLIERLMELQRSELGGDPECAEREGWAAVMEMRPFARCVARFAVQLEVGEGLRQREKRGFKMEVLKRAREAALSDAEAANVLAEVLWGSSP